MRIARSHGERSDLIILAAHRGGQVVLIACQKIKGLGTRDVELQVEAAASQLHPYRHGAEVVGL